MECSGTVVPRTFGSDGVNPRTCFLIRAKRNIFLVVMAAGIHPFPFRTRKLSLPAPMVLGTWVPGRVGRCRITNAEGGAEKSRPVRVFSIYRGMVSPWKSQKVIVEMTNPLGIDLLVTNVDLLVTNVEMKDVIRTQIETKEVILNLRMFEKIGEV